MRVSVRACARVHACKSVGIAIPVTYLACILASSLSCRGKRQYRLDLYRRRLEANRCNCNRRTLLVVSYVYVCVDSHEGLSLVNDEHSWKCF